MNWFSCTATTVPEIDAVSGMWVAILHDILDARLSCTNHGLLLLLAGVDAVGGGGGPRRESSPMY